MPIEYEIRDDLRLVWATARGVLTSQELFEYQRTVWARPEVHGYNELVDMTAVTDIRSPTPDGMRALAALSAASDQVSASRKFAIVAPDDLAFGLGRMYQTHRGLQGESSKEVAVFRTVPQALEWMGLETTGGG